MDSQKTSQEPLWSHQQNALLRAKNKYALFFDPGCGKSRTAIELYKREMSWCKRILIVAPLNVCRNWKDELGKYLGVDHECTIISGQSKTVKIKLLQSYIGSHLQPSDLVRQRGDLPHFLIVNTECFRSKCYRDLLAKTNCSFVIVDESHNFKSPTSLQTKGLFDVLGYLRPAFLYLLTGTPAPQGEIDLWSTFQMLGVTNLPFFVWRKKYFDDRNARRAGTTGYYPDYKIRESSKLEFQGLLSQVSITAKKDEVLDLPPLIRTNVYCELSPEQRKHYDTMEDFFFAADSEGNELNATNILSRTLRLQQILSGFIDTAAIPDNSRLAALRYAIEQTSGDQFIIWTIFKPTYKQLASLLDDAGITFGMLTGDQSPELRHSTIADFQAGKIRALIAHPRAGGVGVNLTAASYSIHYTKNYNLVDDLQCEARNYRGGSERHKTITRIDIIAEDTIDEDITEALRGKKEVQDFILGLKDKRNRRKGNG